MMNRTEMNEEMMVQVNGGTWEDEATKRFFEDRAARDEIIDLPDDLRTPDGKHFHSDGRHHQISMDVK